MLPTITNQQNNNNSCTTLQPISYDDNNIITSLSLNDIITSSTFTAMPLFLNMNHHTYCPTPLSSPNHNQIRRSPQKQEQQQQRERLIRVIEEALSL